jgi:hypothetical protein
MSMSLRDFSEKLAGEIINNSNFTTVIQRAFERVRAEAKREERETLIGLIREYAKGSGWGQLLIEKLEQQP